uniref:thioredoxin-dependent peroxiredoxin n=2 Tax=Cyprinus carpio TaxID=7962 RepID=A0A9J8CK38_CYPCA
MTEISSAGRQTAAFLNFSFHIVNLSAVSYRFFWPRRFFFWRVLLSWWNTHQISTSNASPSDPLNRTQLQSIRSSYRSMTCVCGRRETCFLQDSAMDVSRCVKTPREWLGVVCTLLLLTESVLCDGADGKKEQECYNYAGGHVYPGEAFRVPVSDHSLHLSKAKISKPAPHWEGTAVINGEFKELKLSDYKGKYLVFFFYPLDFTFVCPTEIIAFSDRVHEFQAINAEVVACSVDSQFTHLAWINTPRKQGGLGPMKIPLLSDLTHQISKDYGVFLEDQGHTLRGLFIIDDKGVLRQITMNDLPVGRSVDETLRLVQAFQYTDKHGEVCPAGWKPGSDTEGPNAKQVFWEWPEGFCPS